MERILIPTDFSPSAGNAIEYALLFFKGIPCTFRLLNTYTPEFINSRIMATSMSSMQAEDPIQEQSELGLQKTVDALKLAYPDSGITFEILSSFRLLTEEIREHTETGQIQLIIAGSFGASGPGEVFLGSTIMRIIKSASTIPVLVVPKEAETKVPKRIGFATDFDKAFTVEQLDFLLFFTARFHSELVILHLGSPLELNRLQEFHKRQLDLELALLHPEIRWIMEADAKAGLLPEAAKFYSIDLLVFIRNDLHFLDNWLREPVVKRGVFRANVPILLLPNAD